MVSFFMSFPFEWQALLMGLLTWFITALGSSLVFFFKKVSSSILNIMMGVSAGIMISASIWSLLNPAIEQATKLEMTAWLVASLGFMVGCIFLYLSDIFFERLLSKNKRQYSKLKRIWMLVFSITLHNIPEGLAIGVAFGSLAFNNSPALFTSAVALAIGIGIQNFPEGCAISLPLRREGISRFKAFLAGALSAIVEPISAFCGALLVLKVQNILPFFLAFAAGAMMYVVVKELIPESQQDKNSNLMALFTLIGFTIMMVLDIALG